LIFGCCTILATRSLFFAGNVVLVDRHHIVVVVVVLAGGHHIEINVRKIGVMRRNRASAGPG
jgi:hypothetical protein